MDNQHSATPKKYTNPKDYYPHYLTLHQNTTNRVLHFIGIGLTGLCFITAMLFHLFTFFALMLVTLFLFAWIGHQFFERNKSETWKHPFLNLGCDCMLFGDILMGRQSFKADQL